MVRKEFLVSICQEHTGQDRTGLDEVGLSDDYG